MKVLVEQCQKVNINKLVRSVKNDLVSIKLFSKIEALGQIIEVTTTPCYFGNKRFWFICPSCKKRVGTLYKPPTKNGLLCRHCHNLKYRKSRYKGMIENFVI